MKSIKELEIDSKFQNSAKLSNKLTNFKLLN
jgi:hypothetical protein